MSLTDPFLSTDLCVQRLLDTWIKHGQILVALDFDDTVFPYHDQTHIHPRVLQLVRDCAAEGALIMVYTASSPDRFAMMVEFLSERGIPVAAVNEHPFPMDYGNWGKLYYNILLDDKAGLLSAVETLERTLVLYRAHKASL